MKTQKTNQLSIFILLIVLAFNVSVLGQTAEEERRKRDQIWQEQLRKSSIMLPKTEAIPPPPISKGAISPAELKRQKEIRKNEEAEIAAQRSANPEDLGKYADFLKQKNTGIFKLFPDLRCDSQFIVKVAGDCEKAVQDSYSYSIQKRIYTDGVFHDIRIEENRLWLDGFLSQSMVAELGNIPIESVSLQNNYAEFLTKFKPSDKNSEARKQFWEIGKKVSFNGFIYGKVVKLNMDATYLARIINYRIDNGQFVINRLTKEENKSLKLFQIVSFDTKRTDTIVAFRVVRKGSDNSVTILWRTLVERKSPSLWYSKNEKIVDLKQR